MNEEGGVRVSPNPNPNPNPSPNPDPNPNPNQVNEEGGVRALCLGVDDNVKGTESEVEALAA